MKISEMLKKQREIYEHAKGVKNTQMLRGILEGQATAITLAKLMEDGVPEEMILAMIAEMTIVAESLNANDN